MIHHGDCLAVLQTLPEASVQCCVTSPPYYGLRDYGVDGQIGLEKTPDEFIARLVAVFSEVRRVLKPDGTLWVNIGDSYATGAGKACSPGGGSQGENFAGPRGYKGAHADSPKHAQVPDNKNPNACVPTFQPNRMPLPGLKPKDMIGIPWMLAFALRSEGWWLRQDIIWHKPNPMPESVQDRCTKAHEYVFLFSKSQRYRFDSESIAEKGNIQPTIRDKAAEGYHADYARGDRFSKGSRVYGVMGQRNRRSVWTLATMPTPEAHFATFPIELPELCIKASTGPGDTVLDPFAGAGTTWLACLKHGREFIGIELNEEYIRIAEERARKHYSLLVNA